MSLSPLISDSLSKWKELYEEGQHEEALYHLLAIMQASSEMLYKKDTKSLNIIRNRLIEKLSPEEGKPFDMPSFLLGMAQAMAQQIIYWEHPLEEEQLAKGLSLEEELVLKSLKNNSYTTTSEISEKTGIGKITLTPILRKLTAYDLAYQDSAGKEYWYLLTISGQRILEILADKEEK